MPTNDAAQTLDPWAEWAREIAPVEQERWCKQKFEQANVAQSACIRCGISERIHLRLEFLAARAAESARHAEEVAALRAELDALQREYHVQVSTMTAGSIRAMKASIAELTTRAEKAEAALARLTTPPASQEP